MIIIHVAYVRWLMQYEQTGMLHEHTMCLSSSIISCFTIMRARNAMVLPAWTSINTDNIAVFFFHYPSLGSSNESQYRWTKQMLLEASSSSLLFPCRLTIFPQRVTSRCMYYNLLQCFHLVLSMCVCVCLCVCVQLLSCKNDSEQYSKLLAQLRYVPLLTDQTRT